MSDQGMMNGAEWLARALAGTGMSHVFFVESTMRRTLLQLGDLGVKPVLAHSEKAAAYMADGYARASGELVACNVHVAPGLGNAMGSLFTAFNSGTPLIITAGPGLTVTHLKELANMHLQKSSRATEVVAL